MGEKENSAFSSASFLRSDYLEELMTLVIFLPLILRAALLIR